MDNLKKIFTALLCVLFFLLGNGCGNADQKAGAKAAKSNAKPYTTTTKAKNVKQPQAKISVITGKVVRVADGDTLTVLGEGNVQYKIRLSAIDAPEKKQPFGTRAKQALSEMTMSKNITVKVLNKDKYGRYLGLISTDEIPDVNGAMLEKGMAWHYAYFDKTEKYAELEQEARDAKRGLWQDDNPTPPWNYRRSKKKK